MKKRGFGEGKYNGAGGKIEGGETIIAGAKRELREETGIHISEEMFEQKGLFHFTFKNRPDWDQDVTLFIARNYNGEVFETEEMRPEWFELKDIPYDSMWSSDIIWLPRVLEGESVEYDFNFNENGEILSFGAIK
ncbi:MAG: 8-oxo-dGTP diphosphatase [Candidatus Gracilibacteria bacterium]|nr:8-oxo-dGTP diphosphatase [Candidatus Gracilibacteria bacterium]